MDDWAVLVTEPPVPPASERPGWRRFGWPIVAAVVVVALAVVLVVHLRASALASVDRPGGHQQPLVTTLVAHDPGGASLFSIRLPSQPEPAGVATNPDGSVNFGSVRLGGAGSGVLLLVRGGSSWPTSPRESLEKEVESTASAHLATATSSIRSTRVGATPAYACDFVMSSGMHLREFRFSHDGQVYSAGILYQADDSASLDTALAALQTWHWVS